MKLRLCSLIVAWAVALGAAGIDPENYIRHVKYLASPELAGRGTGTPGLELAAAYIARQFQEAGLKTPSADGWFQAFSVTTNAQLGEANELAVTHDGVLETLTFREDFIPFNFSSGGAFAGQIVFAGYGITAAEYNYDDYAGIDATGKFVLVLVHEPQEYDEDSIFAGKVYTEHSQLFSKAVNAKLHGARGVLFVNDTANHGGHFGDLTEFAETVGPNDPGIPVIHVHAREVKRWMENAGRDMGQVQEAIDEDLRPRSFAFPVSTSVRVRVDVSRELTTVRNVAGYLPGRTDEYVIIGAHYDHIGLGEQFSMAPAAAGTIHPGADDNASGTAGLIELAHALAAQQELRRGILFLAFAGEELGLLGSSYYVNHPALPVENAVAMINMDMIGRPRNYKVYIGGVDTGDSFREMLEAMLPAGDLDVEFSDSTGYGSSDHTSFMTKQVPVLFFFSGLHSDYHRPADTWDRIEGPQTARLLEFVAELISRLANSNKRVRFVRPGR